MAGASLIEIEEDRVRGHYKDAYGLLEEFRHAPRKAEPRGGGSGGVAGSGRRFRSTVPISAGASSAPQSSVKIAKRIADVDDEDPLESETQAHVTRVLRRGIAVAWAVCDLYEEQTRLSELKRQNLRNRLPDASRSELSELLAAQSLIALFVTASYTLFALSEMDDGGEASVGPPAEILLDRPQEALMGTLWELDARIAEGASDDSSLLKVLRAHMEGLVEAVQTRAESAPGLSAFKNANYRVEADGFDVAGFSPATRSGGGDLVMSFKEPEEVVGNHVAKHQAMKLAKMVMAYDFDRQMNPFADLGGFIFTFLGDGSPGTGKTTLIQMMAGLIHGYCENAGYPFRYENLSTESIDSYQGKSGQNAKRFVRNVMDPKVIGFGTIDDIDQIAGKRGDKNASAGQQEVTSVLMESFAGANTVVRGNCTFGMFSNYPENVDDALRQRAGARFLIDGPQQREDYIDILALLLGDNHEIPMGGHEFLSEQEIKSAVEKTYELHSRPQEEQLAEVLEAVENSHGALDTIEKLGSYLKAIQEADERFTGRAVKNITDAVKVRAADVEIPDDWMEDPDLFLRQGYETKKSMIGELMNPITPEMVLQEVNRYADSEFRYANTADEAEIEEMVRQARLRGEAERRLKRA